MEENVAVVQKPKKKKRHQFLFVLFMGLVLMFAGQILGYIPVLLVSRGMADGGWLFLLDTYASFIGIDLLVLFYTFLAEKEIFRNFLRQSAGGPASNSLKMLGLGLFAGFLLNVLCAVSAYLAGDLDFSFGVFDVPYLLSALVLIFIQSAAEELVARGYLHMAIRERYGWIAGLILNCGFFAALHLGNPGVTPLSMANLFLWGMLCTLIVEFTGSMWFVMAAHASWNFTQNILLGLPNSGIVSPRSLLHLEAASDSLMYSVSFGIEGGMPAVVFQAALCVLLIAYRGRIRSMYGMTTAASSAGEEKQNV